MTAAHRIFPLALLALLVALAVVFAAQPAQAQTVLTLGDFNDARLDVEMAVLFQAPATITNDVLFARGRFGNIGTVLDGDDGSGNIPLLSDPPHPNDPADTTGNFIRLRLVNSQSRVNINDDGDLTLSTYFQAGGAGNDLSLYVQTVDGGVASQTVITGLAGGVTAGGNFANFDLTTAVQAALQGIGGGDRFIFALARPAAVNASPPTLNPLPTDERIKVGNTVRLTTNAPTGVQNWTVSETQGTGDATLHTSDLVNCTSQTNEISIAAGSAFWAGQCTAGTTTLGVVDNADSSNTEAFAYTILPANAVPSFDNATYTFSVSEDAAGSANVGTPLTATDGDADADTLTFSSLTGDSNFTLDAGSGQISLIASPSLNFEDTTQYTLTATVSDSPGNPHGTALTGTTTITVNITDVNEPPVFADATAARSVDENEQVGTNIGVVITATDADPDTLSYSITGANPAGFTVTSGGQVQTGPTPQPRGNCELYRHPRGPGPQWPDRYHPGHNHRQRRQRGSILRRGGLCPLRRFPRTAPREPMSVRPCSSPTPTSGTPRASRTIAPSLMSPALGSSRWPPVRSSTLKMRTSTTSTSPSRTPAG